MIKNDRKCQACRRAPEAEDCAHCKWIIRGSIAWILGVLVLWLSVLAYWATHAR